MLRTNGQKMRLRFIHAGQERQSCADGCAEACSNGEAKRKSHIAAIFGDSQVA